MLDTHTAPLMATVNEACAMLRIRRTTLNRLMKEGRLPRCKVGRRTLLPVSALRAFAASLHEAA